MHELHPSAETTMEQAPMTATLWLREAKKAVDNQFPTLSDANKAALIKAHLQASAMDQLTMTIRSAVEAIPHRRE